MLKGWYYRHKILHYAVLSSNLAAKPVQDDNLCSEADEMRTP